MPHPTYATGPLHAEAYEAMLHDPDNPRVAESYRSLSTVIAAQWNGLRTMGFQFRSSQDDPYSDSRAMLEAVGYGALHVFTDGGATLAFDHPMQAAPTAYGAVGAESEGFRTMNDVFRGVHDVMGHYRAHYAGLIASFGEVGEYNAWWSHYQTMPSEAYLALWCETRGQNAWTNFYANHQELEKPSRPYAAQKAGVPQLPLVDIGMFINPIGPRFDGRGY